MHNLPGSVSPTVFLHPRANQLRQSTAGGLFARLKRQVLTMQGLYLTASSPRRDCNPAAHAQPHMRTHTPASSAARAQDHMHTHATSLSAVRPAHAAAPVNATTQAQCRRRQKCRPTNPQRPIVAAAPRPCCKQRHVNQDPLDTTSTTGAAVGCATPTDDAHASKLRKSSHGSPGFSRAAACTATH